VNNSPKIQNWLTSARRSRATGFNDQAAQYYDLVLTEDPNNWEATFFSKYCRAMGSRVLVLKDKAQALTTAAVLSVTLASSLPKDEFRNAVKQIADSSASFFDTAYKTCQKGYNDLWPNITSSYNMAHLQRVSAFILMPVTLGTAIDKINTVSDLSVPLLKGAIERRNSFLRDVQAHGVSPDGFPDCNCTEALKVIRKYDPNYGVVRSSTTTSASSASSGGCYVATCVYGSYDCPQVWTLRRYRDNMLASTRRGRVFIRIYYAVSPTLVAWFGHTNWFKKLWRGKLDRMVTFLQKKGVENTPYEDANW
ncbi:MAG: hypothetical protein K6F09_00030, partial [Clostridiales bacterium]|nr:hypothetical protein [Clostridiales bacterium]